MADEVGGAGGGAGRGARPSWHDGCSPDRMEPIPGSRDPLRAEDVGVDRRALLAAFLGGAALSLGGCVRRPGIPLWRPGEDPPPAGRVFTDGERRTLVAVQDTMWPPGPDVPGASDVGAAAYVEALLARPDVDPREGPAAKAGLARLDAVAAARGVPRFEDLPPADRDTVLRTVAQEVAGAPFVAMVLTYTLEALFGDPIHGGNRGGAVWQWARYEPAEPRLTALPRPEAK